MIVACKMYSTWHTEIGSWLSWEHGVSKQSLNEMDWIFTLFVTDVTPQLIDRFFWSEYRVNRGRDFTLLPTGVRIKWNSLLSEHSILRNEWKSVKLLWNDYRPPVFARFKIAVIFSLLVFLLTQKHSYKNIHRIYQNSTEQSMLVATPYFFKLLILFSKLWI